MTLCSAWSCNSWPEKLSAQLPYGEGGGNCTCGAPGKSCFRMFVLSGNRVVSDLQKVC